MSESTLQYLDPQVLSKLRGLDLIAKLVVEGFMTGLHKSPYHGFSVEFAEHRQYMPGDNLKHVDWKLYGKSDRFFGITPSSIWTLAQTTSGFPCRTGRNLKIPNS